MTLRTVSALLMFVAVAALAQEGQAPPSGSVYSSPRVDFGLVVSDFGKAKTFYEQVLGLTETRNFTVPGDFAKTVGLSDELPFTVHVMRFADGQDATQVKLMEFEGTRPARQDLSFIHSTYGMSYMTFYVADLDKSLKQAAERGVKPIAQGPQAINEEIVPGMGLALVRDPDGNLIELIGPLAKP